MRPYYVIIERELIAIGSKQGNVLLLEMLTDTIHILRNEYNRKEPWMNRLRSTLERSNFFVGADVPSINNDECILQQKLPLVC